MSKLCRPPLRPGTVDRRLLTGRLALTVEEASSLLRNEGMALSEDEVADLHRRTEGWPAGLYIAALAIKAASQDGTAGLAFGGTTSSCATTCALNSSTGSPPRTCRS